MLGCLNLKEEQSSQCIRYASEHRAARCENMIHGLPTFELSDLVMQFEIKHNQTIRTVVQCLPALRGSKVRSEGFAYFDSFSTSVWKLSFSSFQSISQSCNKKGVQVQDVAGGSGELRLSNRTWLQ